MAENTKGKPKDVVSVLESNLDSVDTAEQIVLKAAKELGFKEDEQYQIGMAIRESMVNAVVHGNCYNEHKKVRLSVAKAPDRLIIKIADEGKGVDIDSLPDPLAKENLMKQSGRGILLMKAFMDEFAVRKLEPHGTEFKLVKYLNEKS